jgi:hypothetical protein
MAQNPLENYLFAQSDLETRLINFLFDLIFKILYISFIRFLHVIYSLFIFFEEEYFI